MNSKKILCPLPAYGFDPSEASIPWKMLTESGIELVFITPNGKKSAADNWILKGHHLGIWKAFLRAGKDAVEAYSQMNKSPAFCRPLNYTNVDAKDFDGILLPGGHDKGIKEYLDSEILQDLVVDFFAAKKPVGAVCHGVVLVARSIDPATGKSVLDHYKTTSLLKSQELLAYQLTRLWLHDYYLTYPDITVEEEVKSVLSNKQNFLRGPLPLLRDNLKHLDRGFVVVDRNYLSARWPGDIYKFSIEFLKMIEN